MVDCTRLWAARILSDRGSGQTKHAGIIAFVRSAFAAALVVKL
jgi:hypothetical protein